MMRRLAVPFVIAPVFVAGCAHSPPKHTLGELRTVQPDVQEVHVEQGLDKAMASYRRFLEQTPETTMTPEAMRRLADLQVEKQFGIRAGDGKPREMAAPEKASATTGDASTKASASAGPVASATETDAEFERRTTASGAIATPTDSAEAVPVPGASEASGPLEAIALYDRLLAQYPNYEHADQVLYQKARAYDELGRTEDAMETMDALIAKYPHSGHYDEVQFRRAEYFFTRRKYRDAEPAYAAIISLGASSSYYELALYKLGWTLYKQDFYEEALHKYVALLDYKVSIGYDFDQKHEEEDERRVTDTFRVISLSFSNLGSGPEVVQEYFAQYGHRGYEDRIYANLGEYYLAKRRYDDAAKAYEAFVTLYPFHRQAPRFSMREIEIFTQGNFPKLVLESKKTFASRYGLQSQYWRHYKPEDLPEVLTYLKSNLKDLANHYHAQYQAATAADEKATNYGEALRWYGEYLASFPSDGESPAINYQLADLLLEHKDFGEAAKQYERTAYQYPTHAKSAAAGYAAVYAYREQLKTLADDQREPVVRATVASSIRFADTFPQHEEAAPVLGAAADDLYKLKDFAAAATAGQRVIDQYPAADPQLRRAAANVVAHASFELADYPRAEHAYVQVLAATSASDPERAALTDNLAASIYKQGEAANAAQDFRAAADHFLRIRQAAPTSTIRPTAEYDAAAALIKLQDWTAAAGVLEAFRSAYPQHPLQHEVTKQIASVYRQSGQLGRAAGEYDRVATESEDPAMRGEALLLSGDLYEQSKDANHALDVYARYVQQFPHPVETAVETRHKMAELRKSTQDEAGYYRELAEIVKADAGAGSERTARTRTLAARSGLVLAEKLYGEFAAVKLLQPFESSLQVKQKLMKELTQALDQLVDYEIADVTAAATYYIAETYAEFSKSLAESQRPGDLKGAQLEQYEAALEEEAYPFEEKAIGVHEKNLELLRTGVVNAWTEKSLGRLAQMVPGRYAKNEMSSGFLGSIDSYAYRSPASLMPAPTPPTATGNTAPAPEGNEPKTAPAAAPAAEAAPVQTTQLERSTDTNEVVAHATQR